MKPMILRTFFLILLLPVVAAAQKPVTKKALPKASAAPMAYTPAAPFSGVRLPSSFGELRAEAYAADIIKLTVKANGDRSADLISDAVVLTAPRAQSKVPVKAVGADSFLVGDRVLMTTYFDGVNKGFRVYLQPGERVFGGGERALPLNRRGYRLNLNNNPWYGYSEGADNLNYSVPFVTSSAGYGLFFDNPARGYIDIGKEDSSALLYATPSGEWNVYVLLGGPAQVLSAYHRLTGTQPLPPRWAFGNLMSRFGYTSEKQTREILSKMQQEGMPVDAVIFDLFWFGDSIKGTMGNLDWVNKAKWPNPGKMIADFRKQGVHSILITEPFFVETSKNYTASRPYLAVDSAGRPYTLTDFYFGRGGLIDIFRTDAQNWFWQFYRKQMQLGVEGWWGDLGEPEKHPANMYHNLRDMGFRKRLYQADEVHNIYGHAWTKMLFRKFAEEYPNKRLFSLNRSGFAGSQRFGIFPWSGDVSRSWSGFRAQLPVLLGMTMSGVPYVHSDAGGFAGGEGDNELYVRWLQFAVFTPIFRPHGTALYEVEPAAPSFPSEAALIDTPWRNHAREAIALRYSLLPYNYSLAYQQATSGKPLMAPLYYHFPGDSIAAAIGDQYLWGEHILVAPVLEKGAARRRLYLPEGRWIDGGGRILQGRQWIDVPVDMRSIPWFIRAGGIVPGQQNLRGPANTANDREAIPFLMFAPARTPSSFDWYLDDGVSKDALKKGNYTLLRCSGEEGPRKTVFRITPSNQLYTKNKLVVQLMGYAERPRAVLINGIPVPMTDDKAPVVPGTHGVSWDPAHSAVNVMLAEGMKRPVVIEVER